MEGVGAGPVHRTTVRISKARRAATFPKTSLENVISRLAMLRHPPGPGPVMRILFTLLTGAVCLCVPFAVRSESAAGSGGGSASASLMFRIVIPSVLVVDSRTGTMYTNDRKFVAQQGVLDVREMGNVPRTAWSVVGAPAPNVAGASRGAPSRAVAGGLQRDRVAVLCSP